MMPGDRRLGPTPRTAQTWALAAVGVAPFVSAAMLVGVTGWVMAQGHDGLSMMLGLAGGAFLWATVFGRQYGANLHETTLVASLARRYESWWVGLVTGLVLALCLVVLLAAELAAAASSLIVVSGPLPISSITATGILLCGATLALESSAARWATAPIVMVGLLALLVLTLLLVLISISGHDGPGAILTTPTLQNISNLEQALLEKHLADPSTFKPFASPFLRTDVLNTLALTASLSLGLAALASARSCATSPNAGSRARARSVAVFVAILALVPAVAASGRRTLLDVFVSGLKADALPDWLLKLYASGLVQICGKSGLDVATLAKSCGKGVGPQGLMRWQDFNIDPDAVVFASLRAVGSSFFGAAALSVFMLTTMVAAAWTARNLARTLAASLTAEPSDYVSTRTLMVLIAAEFMLATVFLTTTPVSSVTLLVWSASLAAAGLAPILLAAYAKYPPAVAAFIAMPLGVSVAIVLMLTPVYDPIDAFAFSSWFTGAPPMVIRKLASLMQTHASLPDGPGRLETVSQISQLARDSVTWLGLKPLASGVFGLLTSATVMAAGVGINALRFRRGRA